MPNKRGPRESQLIFDIVRRIEDRVFELYGPRGKTKYADRVANLAQSTFSRAMAGPQTSMTDGVLRAVDQNDPKLYGIWEELCRARAEDAMEAAEGTQEDGRTAQRQQAKQKLYEAIKLIQEAIDAL